MSDGYCELCGEDDGFVDRTWVEPIKISLLLCTDCQKKVEERVGYSHIIEKIVCPTCHHRRVKMRRYNAQDGVFQCDECKKYFAWTSDLNGQRLCEKCAAREAKRMEEEKANAPCCPECNRAMDFHQRTKINGWVVGQHTCKCGYESEEVKIRKLDKMAPPEGVAPLFAEAKG